VKIKTNKTGNARIT